MTKLDRFLTPNEQKEVEKDMPISLRNYYEGLEHPRLYILDGESFIKKLEDVDLWVNFMFGDIAAWVDKNIAYIIVDDDTVGDDPDDIINYLDRFIKLNPFLTPNEQL